MKLSMLKNIGDAFLATMDVESRRPSCYETLFNIKTEWVHATKWLYNYSLLNGHLIMYFADDVFRQIKGTAMGACFAPSCACLFLGLWEKEYIHNTCNPFFENLIFYCRYIDDVFFCFEGTEPNLLHFYKYVNSINPNIRMTLEYSQREITFLDLLISKEENGDLNSSIFWKSTDRNTVLRADVSFHSPQLINNIPYGQFLRLKMICDRRDNSQSHGVWQNAKAPPTPTGVHFKLRCLCPDGGQDGRNT